MLNLSAQELLQELKPVFYPQSIAVIGASPKNWNAGSGWVQGLVAAGFRGNIYPVNPRGGEMLGLKIYANLMAIPGNVDYVLVAIPREAVPSLLDECAAKRVKVVHFFTAGYGELGDATGRRLEEGMVQKARQGGFHIIGPNCIGNYCPESRVPLGAEGLLGEKGTVGFLSQSGGIAGKLAEIGIGRGIARGKGERLAIVGQSTAIVLAAQMLIPPVLEDSSLLWSELYRLVQIDQGHRMVALRSVHGTPQAVQDSTVRAQADGSVIVGQSPVIVPHRSVGTATVLVHGGIAGAPSNRLAMVPPKDRQNPVLFSQIQK